MKAFFLFAVIQNYIKTSRKRDNELVQMFVCVTTPLGSSGNVIKIINTLDLKGHMSPPFNEGKIAPWITDFGQVNNHALG